MKTEKSCGAILFTRENGRVQYCLIRQTNGDFGFPKGHMEPGETERETALREIFEEVGLNVTLLEGFRRELYYPLPRRPDYIKHTVYFLGEFGGQIPLCQPEEVAEVLTMTYEQAMQTITFPDLREVLEKANAYLNCISILSHTEEEH